MLIIPSVTFQISDDDVWLISIPSSVNIVLEIICLLQKPFYRCYLNTNENHTSPGSDPGSESKDNLDTWDKIRIVLIANRVLKVVSAKHFY